MENRYCNRCDTAVSYATVSAEYFAVCETHEEDLYKFETYEKGNG
jgi:hypothetical protein